MIHISQPYKHNQPCRSNTLALMSVYFMIHANSKRAESLSVCAVVQQTSSSAEIFFNGIPMVTSDDVRARQQHSVVCICGKKLCVEELCVRWIT